MLRRLSDQSVATFDYGVIRISFTLFSGTRVGSHAVVNTTDKLNWSTRFRSFYLNFENILSGIIVFTCYSCFCGKSENVWAFSDGVEEIEVGIFWGPVAVRSSQSLRARCQSGAPKFYEFYADVLSSCEKYHLQILYS